MGVEEPLVELGGAMARFAGLVDDAIGNESVPSCPGWTSADLISHLGSVHRWSAAIVLSRERIAQLPQVTASEPLAEWYAGTATALLAALQAVDPDEPVPNLSGRDEVAAFWARRQLHETTVHGVDLAQALDRPEDEWGIDPLVAADGVGEVFHMYFSRLTDLGRRPHVTAPVRFTATDLDRTWIVTVDPEGPDAAPALVRDTGQEVSGTASATAVELYLGLWNRLPGERIEASGAAVAVLEGPTVP